LPRHSDKTERESVALTIEVEDHEPVGGEWSILESSLPAHGKRS
jgi:hypothetical protein